MTKAIIEHFEESIRVKQSFLRDNLETLIQAIDALVGAFQKGNKLLLFGTAVAPLMLSISPLSS